jgi:hypothetical protein
MCRVLSSLSNCHGTITLHITPLYVPLCATGYSILGVIVQLAWFLLAALVPKKLLNKPQIGS